MKVVDHAEGAWTLYRLGQELFLEAACHRGAFGFSVLIRLDGDETHAYGMGGRHYAGTLATSIRTSMANDEPTYAKRDVAGLYSDKVAAAVEAWHARVPDTEPDPGADATATP